MSTSKKPTASSDMPPAQLDKFRELARELDVDEDEARFDETLKRIAPKPPEPKPE